MSNSALFTTADPVVIGPIGRCIYGADHPTNALTREHVIPHALGGGLILLSASCEACRKITHEFETDCLSSQLGTFRKHLSYPSRKRKDQATHIRITAVRGDVESEEMLPLEFFPRTFSIPRYLKPPGVYGGQQPDAIEQDIVTFSAPVEEVKNGLKELGIDYVKFVAAVHVESFSRMLAKISHGIATAMFGNQFVPLLLPVILEANMKVAAFLMGGGERLPNGNDIRNHMFMVDFQKADSGLFLVRVHIRFFVGIENTPTYQIFSGYSAAEPIMDRASWKRHEQKAG